MMRFADVDSFLALCNSGTVYCVLLTSKDGSTYELRGAQMWRWLNEYSQRWKAPKTALSASQTSLAFARRPDAASLARTLRRARG